MGRAIDMERDIDELKAKVEKLENIVRGMTHTISERKNIDILEETKQEKTDAKKEKTNNERNDTSSVKSNKRSKSNAGKSSKP